MNRGTTLGPAAISQLKQTVRAVMGKGKASGYLSPFPNGANTSIYIWALITESTEIEGVYQHAWTQVIRNANGFANIEKGTPSSGTTETNYAIAPDGSQVTDNTYVALFYNVAIDNATNPNPTGYWTIGIGGGGGLSGKGQMGQVEIMTADNHPDFMFPFVSTTI